MNQAFTMYLDLSLGADAQEITPPFSYGIELEDGSGVIQLEAGGGFIELESGP